MQKAKKVLIALRMAGEAGRQKLAGIFSYLGAERPWEITLVRTAAEFTSESVAQAVSRGVYDGYVLSIPGTSSALAPLAKATVPAVVMDIHDAALAQRRENIVFVRNSAQAVGAAAANCLMNTGRCRSYAFCHNPAIREWSDDRFLAFRETLAERGLLAQEIHALRELSALARPAGIFAANDDTGYAVLEYCRKHHLRVPDDVLVLGLNNDTLICENCSPQLSSIEPDFFQEGVLAARALDTMMRGDGVPAHEYAVGVRRVVARESVRAPSPSGKLVQQMLAFIRAHRREKITVDDVAAASGCSRRLADLRFRELMGATLGETIISARLDEVCMLLETSTATIESIALACGYANPNYLKNLFKKRFGMTMRDWRRVGNSPRLLKTIP